MAKASASSRLYRLSRPVVRAGMRLFFTSIEVQHGERIPSEGPVILAANHPNSIMDPFALGVATARTIHFLAASVIFSSKLKSAFLRGAGVVPIYRRQDDPTEMNKNVEVFEACFKTLTDGGAIAIFPEGVTHTEPRVLPLKTGAARIGLGAEARHGYELGVKIIPMGLTYSDPTRFRSRLLVSCGKPIVVNNYAELNEKDERESIKRLTANLQRRLESLVLNLPSPTLAKMTEDLLAVYAEELLDDPSVAPQLPVGMAGEVALSQEMRNAVAYLSHTAPAIAEEMHKEVRRYTKMLNKLRLRRDLLKRKPKAGVAAVGLWYLVVASLGFLPALYGAVNNYIPYKTTQLLAARYSPHRETFVATAKFLGGGLVFSAFYGAQTAVVWRNFGVLVGAVYGVSLPLTGLWTLSYRDAVKAAAASLRYAWLKRRHRRLLARVRLKRRQVLAELDAWKNHYLAARERDRRVATGANEKSLSVEASGERQR